MLVAAEGVEGLTGGDSEYLITGGGDEGTLPVVCGSGAALVCEVRWTRGRDADRRTPHEREIDGPAV